MFRIHNNNKIRLTYFAGEFFDNSFGNSFDISHGACLAKFSEKSHEKFPEKFPEKFTSNSIKNSYNNSPKKVVRQTPKRSFEVYKIILHNDTVTPVHFVVRVIQIVFEKSPAESHGIMYEAHVHGKVLIGFFPKDIANAHIKNVYTLAQKHGYPLHCSKLLVQ